MPKSPITWNEQIELQFGYVLRLQSTAKYEDSKKKGNREMIVLIVS